MGIEGPNFEEPVKSEDELSVDLEERVEQVSEKREKTIIEKIKGKASKVANAMMLVSALSAVPGVVKSAEAQNVNRPKVGDVEKGVGKNITESGSWARNMLNSTLADVSKLKTAEDAEWFVRRQVGSFIMEWHQPTKGTLETDSHGLKFRVSTDEDLDLILECAKLMDKILDEVNAKFSTSSYENKKGDLGRMIKSYENQTSYAGKQQRKAMENVMRNR